LKYKVTAILFAVLTFYMIIAAIVSAIQAAEQGGAIYRTMLFSVVITYGGENMWIYHLKSLLTIAPTVYAFSSLLAFDPWHLITSFIPYIFLSPTFINILNM